MPDSTLLLPEGTVLVHVGPFKTGTTAVQAALRDASPALRDAGVVRLGRRRNRRAAVRHVLHPGRPDNPIGAEAGWATMVRQVERLGTARAVLSDEHWSDADDDAIARAVDGLGPHVHVVFTLRPLARLLPSQWQQFLVRKLDLPYDEWLRLILSPDHATDPHAVTFWHRHRHDQLVARWARVVGPENVTVIVLDPQNRAMLGETFEAMLGLPGETLAADRAGRGSDNRSFTEAEAEMLRSYNTLIKERGLTDLQSLTGQPGYAVRLRDRTPASDEPKLKTPAWALDRAGEIGREIADSLRSSGVRIVGDLDVLTSTAGEVGEPTEALLPPAVGAAFAVAIHESATAQAPAPARPPRPSVSLANVTTRALLDELKRRTKRKLTP